MRFLLDESGCITGLVTACRGDERVTASHSRGVDSVRPARQVSSAEMKEKPASVSIPLSVSPPLPFLGSLARSLDFVPSRLLFPSSVQ